MATPTHYDSDSATRQVHINEWSYNNKMDTLFVFQIVFIALLFSSIMVILKDMGTFGTSFMYYSVGIVATLVVIIIINRIVFTQTKRDRTSWDRRTFSDDNTRQTPLKAGDASYKAYINKLEKKTAEASSHEGHGDKCDCKNSNTNRRYD
jgi:hypothetical protein